MLTDTPRFITIHMIQNHVPANLNRDDLGAPKMAYFGGALRARISSQCLKRSIRRSDFFAPLCAGIRTRRLLELVAQGDKKIENKLRKALKELGFDTRDQRNKASKKQDEVNSDHPPTAEDAAEGKAESNLAIFLSVECVRRLHEELTKESDPQRILNFVKSELERLAPAPDIALFGRMLEAQGLSNTKIEAACQVAHAISTHESIPEVDYFTAVDDVPGSDAGAAYLDEAAFASACFYKFFSIDWRQLCKNLTNAPSPELLAAKTLMCFLKAAALAIPTGKKNAYAPFNPPSLIIVELRDFPMNYANAFAQPVPRDSENIVAESIARVCAFCAEADKKFASPTQRWCLCFGEKCCSEGDTCSCPPLCVPAENLENLAHRLLSSLGFSPDEVEKVELESDKRLDTLLSEHAKTRKLEASPQE